MKSKYTFVEGKLKFNCNFVDHWFLKRAHRESAALNRERSFFRDYVKTLTHVTYMRQGLDLSKNLKESIPIGMGGWVCALLRNQWSTKLQLNFNFPSTKVSLVQFPISFPTGFLNEAPQRF